MDQEGHENEREEHLKAALDALAAQQRMFRDNLHRAHVAGQGQVLRALLEEVAWTRGSLDSEDLRMVHVEGWAMDKLKELGEEPREERT